MMARIMPYTSDPDLAGFIQSLPKTETHLHIEGALPWELLVKADPGRFRHPPAAWRDDFRYGSFKEFEDYLIEHALVWFRSPERYFEAARILFSRHVEQNVHYVETSFHAGMIELLDLPGQEILQAIRAAAPRGLEVRVFMGMLRFGHSDRLRAVLEESLEWPELAGIDLHGPELGPIADWMPDFWARARAAGKETKAHAGEFGGPEYVREVVERLGVRRIQHGIRAAGDPVVVALLRACDATLDICPISNVKLQAVAAMAEHPIGALARAGVRCTVSTDDPFSFGNRLNEEYAALHHGAGLSRGELVRLARNGWEVAAVEEPFRRKHLDLLDAIAGHLEEAPGNG